MDQSTIDDLKQALAYNPETGAITWKKPIGRKTKVGQQCLYVSPDGYIQIGYRGKSYQGHRVAWVLQTGAAPPECLDHINRVRADNKWTNLRAASRKENILNGKTRIDNKSSGHRGVTWLKSCNRWYGRVQLDGKVTRKAFINKDDAIQWVRQTRMELFGQFDPKL